MKRRTILAALYASTLLTILCMLPAAMLAQQQSEQDSNTWLGTLDVGVAKLRLQIVIDFDEEGNPTATLTSLDQNNAEIKVESLTVDGNTVEMSMPSVAASFKGDLNDDHTECTGTFTQNGKEFPLTFRKVDAAKSLTHVETWAGTMKAGPQTFEFQLRVYDDSSETQTLKLDSFTESISGLHAELTRSENEFNFVIPATAAEYKGKINDAKDKITGTWNQNGAELDLVFESVPLDKTREQKLSRPQTPKEPFPYDSTELTVKNISAKLTLSGTLTTPKSDGPFATVILVSGSGPQDRDETILGHKPFAVLADHLTRAGLAVFRYDERGVGKSTGEYAGATTQDFASDVEAIIKHLRKHPKVRKDQIGIIGHSEGGLVAPMIAAKDRQLAFIVLMAGPGVPGKQILLTQSRAIASASGVPEAALEINERILKNILDHVSPDNTESNIVQNALDKFKETLDPETRDDMEIPEAAKAQFEQFETPWFRFFNVYDPLPALKRTRCPVLSVIGEKDLQVDCEMNQAAIEKALKEGNNPDFTISKLPDLNHLFQECETGSPAEYRQIEQTISPVFLELVTDWILKRVSEK